MSATSVTLDSGVRLSCAMQGGDGRPTLVLLPGPTDSWRSYEPVLARLPGSVRAIAVSMRGHGDSDKPDGGYAIGDFAGDVVALLDAVEIDRAVLVGHSGSCLVARSVALDHPDRVAGLVLEASPTRLGGEAALRSFVRSSILTLADPIDPDFVRSFVVGTSSDDVAPAFVDTLVEDALKVPARVWHAMFSALLDYDDTAELTSIGAPVLLVWGDGDEVVAREMQDALAARIPIAELIVYPSVGHTPRWEVPERFTDDVVAFVERLDGARSP